MSSTAAAFFFLASPVILASALEVEGFQLPAAGLLIAPGIIDAVLGEAPDVGDPVVLRRKRAHHHAKQEREQPHHHFLVSSVKLLNSD